MFKYQIEKMIELYFDDMIAKSEKGSEHARDLKEALEVIDKFGMKLNLEKCAFRVKAWKFLGFMISQWGIEANLEKNTSNNGDETPTVHQGSTKVEWMHHNLETLHFLFFQKMPVILPSTKMLEELQMDGLVLEGL